MISVNSDSISIPNTIPNPNPSPKPMGNQSDWTGHLQPMIDCTRRMLITIIMISQKVIQVTLMTTIGSTKALLFIQSNKNNKNNKNQRNGHLEI